MGARAQRCFDEANRLGGLVAKLRLASLTQVTSTEAATRQDTPDLTAKLETALATVKAEYGNRAASPTTSRGQEGMLASLTKEADTLRRFLGGTAELYSQRHLFLGDVGATARRMTEAAAFTMPVDRVSVWFLDEQRTKIVCADLFERGRAVHTSGVELFAKDFAPYFEALAQERTIAAEDANTDTRTRCFSASYLMPLGIGAMLDVPIWAASKPRDDAGGARQTSMVGVVCCEHVGGKRAWTPDEESFAHLLSSLMAVTLEQVAWRGKGAA